MLVISFGSLFATISAGWTPKLGLDLAGGAEVVLTPANGKITSSQLGVSETIIRNRVAGFGVSGATVDIQGSQVVVQVPGVKNARKLIQLISSTSQLLFRPVECGAPAYVKPGPKEKQYGPLNIPECAAASQLSLQNPTYQVTPDANAANGYIASTPNPDPKFSAYPSITPTMDYGANNSKFVIEPGLNSSSGPFARYVLFPAIMEGTQVANATATQNQLGQWVVDCNLSSKGSAEWDAATKKYFHEYMAIELDGQVVSAPIIQPTQANWTSFQGSVEISGGLSQSQANLLAADLTYGSLPVPLKVQTDESVSPTLGHAALVAGLGAGLAGLALVLLYVVFYYRLLGAVVLTGLAVTAAILWALISALGRTSVAPSFDLAGVTGLIVSIGITTDSYIVYFERLKDEARSGRTVRTSLDRGFASAWRTVLAADTVSLLAAVLLFFLAAGDVRGFAFFLGLSTLLDVIVTWFFTRPAVYLLARSERLTAMRRFGVAQGLGARAPA
jgi:preprotein translocase subunit SecD